MTLAQTTVDRGGELSIDVSAQDARLAMDLLGGLWTLGKDGGEAWPLVDPTEGVMRPQWSPDGTRILFTTQSQDGTRIEVVDPTNGDRDVLVPSDLGGRDAAWHPSGTRIVFSAPRGDRGLDVVEKDLGSGLTWSLTAAPGDESQPAWSPSGRDLAYVHYHDGQWSLMLRRFGQPDGAVFVSSSEIAAPAWRPDGTLLSFYHGANGGGSQQIAILSEPPLVRPVIVGENVGARSVAMAEPAALPVCGRRADTQSGHRRVVAAAARVSGNRESTGLAGTVAHRYTNDAKRWRHARTHRHPRRPTL